MNGAVGKYFRGTITIGSHGDITTRLPKGDVVWINSLPPTYRPVDGQEIAYRVDGPLYEGGASEFFGQVVPDLVGTYLTCQVIGFREGGEPVVRPFNGRGKLRGILEIYPSGLLLGEHVKALVHGHNGKNGYAPTTFFGTVLPRGPSKSLRVSIGV